MILLCSLPSRSLLNTYENLPAMAAPPIFTVMPSLHGKNDDKAT